MRSTLLPLTAASVLLVGTVACSDNEDATDDTPIDTGEVATTTTDATPTTDAGVATTEAESTPTTEADTTTTAVEASPTTEAFSAATTEPMMEPILTGTSGSWAPEDVQGISLSDSNTAPMIEQSLADNRVAEDHWVWDWWPVRDRDGGIADIDGWNVAIALSAPADVLPGKRHDIATHRYLLSNDGGQTWIDGGELFAGDALGTRQWAGSAMYDEENDTLYAFYTAAGEDDAAGSSTTETSAPMATTTAPSEGSDEQAAPSGGTIGDDISYRQRLALATADISVTGDGVEFGEWSDHEILVTGDATNLYATTKATEGGAGQIDAFRDPWYFWDEETDEEYILFTATMPAAECEGDGVVGLARAANDDLTEWEVLPPMLDGHCVNNELERPHIVTEDDRSYLLFTTHSHTFRDGTSGPEGLYGFVADSFLGSYEPLNDTGLVIANPEQAPYQAYSWMTLPNGVATSFFQFFGLGGDVELSYVGDQSPEWQLEHFGGTFAPSLLVDFDDDQTEIVEVLAPGQLTP